MDNSITVQSITKKVPHAEICELFGVKVRSIRLARENGVFPASWYVGMKSLCEKHGVDCPEYLFNFKPPVPDVAIKRGDAKGPRQGATQ